MAKPKCTFLVGQHEDESNIETPQMRCHTASTSCAYKLLSPFEAKKHFNLGLKQPQLGHMHIVFQIRNRAYVLKKEMKESWLGTAR